MSSESIPHPYTGEALLTLTANGAAGAVACGLAYRAWQLPSSAELHLPFWTAAGILAALAALSTAHILWTHRRRRPETPPPDDDRPWTVRPEWRLEAIPARSNALGTEHRVSGAAGFVFVFLGTSIGGQAVHQWPQNASSFVVIMVIFIVPFLLALGYVLWKPIRHRRRYGLPTLDLNPMPGRRGHRLAGRICANVPNNAVPDDGFEVTVRCLDREPTHGDANYATTEHCHTECRVHPRSVEDAWDSADAKDAASGSTEIPFTVDLPADGPPSTLPKETFRTLWEVRVDGGSGGAAFSPVFEIPVLATENGADAPKPD